MRERADSMANDMACGVDTRIRLERNSPMNTNHRGIGAIGISQIPARDARRRGWRKRQVVSTDGVGLEDHRRRTLRPPAASRRHGGCHDGKPRNVVRARDVGRRRSSH